MLFHHDYALTHTSSINYKNYSLKYCILLSRFSTFLTFFFAQSSKLLTGKKFLSDEEIIAAAEGFFGDLEESVYEGIRALQQRWTK